MDAIIYYSPYGGAVRACVLAGRQEGAPRPEPTLELEILQGHLRKIIVPDDHALCEHVANPAEPTVLEGWFVTGERLHRRPEG
mgnify:CR=1 FL=1